MSFTTYDRDNDEKIGANCASTRYGGWWYNACYWACLTCAPADHTWLTLQSQEYAKLISSRMMVKPQ